MTELESKIKRCKSLFSVKKLERAIDKKHDLQNELCCMVGDEENHQDLVKELSDVCGEIKELSK